MGLAVDSYNWEISPPSTLFARLNPKFVCVYVLRVLACSRFWFSFSESYALVTLIKHQDLKNK